MFICQEKGEASQERFNEELRGYATETVTSKELRQSLEDEVQLLTQTVVRTEGEKHEKKSKMLDVKLILMDGTQAAVVFFSYAID